MAAVGAEEHVPATPAVLCGAGAPPTCARLGGQKFSEEDRAAYVPMRDTGRVPVPGTGPYMITDFSPDRKVVFARNPYFREWSAAAQPDGSPDRIVWTFGRPLAREAAEIEAGQADWTNDQLPDITAISAQFPAQVHVNALPSIVYTAFNTRVAPFSDPRVRRAFSLAADRASYVTAIGGPDQAEPACQILPPGIPGHQPYCPFTADPSASGAWIGPDLAAARRLVAASGTAGMHVTVWSDNDNPPDLATSASRSPSCASSATRRAHTSPRTKAS